MPNPKAIDGLSDLLGTLRALPDELKNGPVNGGLREAVKIARDDAKRRAPISNEGDRGRLRENIFFKKVPARDLDAGSDVGYEVYVRSSRSMSRHDIRNAWYWRFVEFGTVNQSAQPFLRPAIEANKRQMVTEYSETFKRLLNKAVGKARRASGQSSTSIRMQRRRMVG